MLFLIEIECEKGLWVLREEKPRSEWSREKIGGEGLCENESWRIEEIDSENKETETVLVSSYGDNLLVNTVVQHFSNSTTKEVLGVGKSSASAKQGLGKRTGLLSLYLIRTDSIIVSIK